MADCPSCGRPARDGAAFCSMCGASLNADLPAQAQAPVQYVQAPVQYAPPAQYVPLATQYAPPGAWTSAPPPGSLVAAAAQGQLMSWNGRPLSPTFANRKVVAGIMGILFGQWGVHKFIVGNVGAGIAMVAITLVSCLLTLVFIGIFGIIAMSVIGIIEGIMYLTKSDDEFIQRYGINHKGWF